MARNKTEAQGAGDLAERLRKYLERKQVKPDSYIKISDVLKWLAGRIKRERDAPGGATGPKKRPPQPPPDDLPFKKKS